MYKFRISRELFIRSREREKIIVSIGMPVAKFSKNCLANVYSRTFRFVKRDRKLLVPRVIFFFFIVPYYSNCSIENEIYLLDLLRPPSTKKERSTPFCNDRSIHDFRSVLFDRSLPHDNVRSIYLSLDKVRVMETMTTLAAR